VALGLIGCARGSDPPLWFTFDGSEQTYRAAVEAADEWSRVCGVDVFVSRDPGGVPMVERPTVSGFRGETQGGTVRDGDGELLRIEISQNTEDVAGVLRHELGHALGVGHSDSGVMRAPHDPGARVTTADCPR
jgi:hypothetical protein